MLDFSRTHVRVEKLSIPIGRELGLRLLDAFERGADDARVEEPTAAIMVDGYTYEILLSARPCVALRNPPRDSQAGVIADLVRFLEGRLQSWQASERETLKRKFARLPLTVIDRLPAE